MSEPPAFPTTSFMLFKIDELIADISRYFTLQKGDVILTGTPEGVGRVEHGDLLIGKIDGIGRFYFEIA